MIDNCVVQYADVRCEVQVRNIIITNCSGEDAEVNFTCKTFTYFVTQLLLTLHHQTCHREST